MAGEADALASSDPVTIAATAAVSQPGALFGSLMLAMVAYDAFTQIYTNPLLSKAIYTADILTAYGLELISTTSSIDALVRRNLPADSPLLAKFGV